MLPRLDQKIVLKYQRLDMITKYTERAIPAGDSKLHMSAQPEAAKFRNNNPYNVSKK